MRSLLITGGTGSFGQAFTKRLLTTDIKSIRILSRDWLKQEEMERELGGERRVRFCLGDIRDRERIRRAMEDIEVVVHAAAIKGIKACRNDPTEAVLTNVMGSMNVIQAAHDAKVKKVVFLSTDKAYQAVSIYGDTKRVAEQMFLDANNTRGARGPLYAVTRYGNVWKSRGSVVPKWQSILALGGRQIDLTDPECTRFYMEMGQAIDLVEKTIDQMPAEIAIPKLPAYRLGDIPVAMGIKPNRIRITGLPKYEKRHESMSEDQCSETAPRMNVEELRAAIDMSPTAQSKLSKHAAGS